MTDAESATATSTSGPPDGPLLFISHRHSDVDIANVIHDFVEDKGGGRVRIFQSSAVRADHPKPGADLTREVHEALWQAKVVILIYTTSQDWSSCAYEVGVARRREGGERIIVVQCNTPPWMFAGSVSIDLRKREDVQKFAVQFLTEKNFFSGTGTAITNHNADSPAVLRAANALYDRLQPVLPPAEDTEEWPACPYLRLELPFHHAADLPESTEDDQATEVITKHAIVTYADSEAAKLFDVRRMFPGTSRDARCAVALAEVVESWRRGFPNSKSRWLEALCAQIVEAVQGGFPTLVWELMYSKQKGDATWYAPFLARVRRVPSEKSWEFDVYFCKFSPGADDRPMIGIPIDDVPRS